MSYVNQHPVRWDTTENKFGIRLLNDESGDFSQVSFSSDDNFWRCEINSQQHRVCHFPAASLTHTYVRTWTPSVHQFTLAGVKETESAIPIQNDVGAFSVLRDSDGNLSISNNLGATSGGILRKHNPDGDLIWDVDGDYYPRQIIHDSSGNTIALCYELASPNKPHLGKWDSDGDNLWLVDLSGYLAYASQVFAGLTTDGSNIYLTGQPSTAAHVTVMKINGANGAVIWAVPMTRGEEPESYSSYGYGCFYFGGFLYVAGSTLSYMPYINAFKLDATNGNIISRAAVTPNVDKDAVGVVVDTSGYVYYASSFSGTSHKLIAMPSDLSSIIWSIDLSMRPYSMCIDSDDYIYIGGQGSPTHNGHNLAKYNTSGSLIWSAVVSEALADGDINIVWSLNIDANDKLQIAVQQMYYKT